ncbi:hypothetical protein KC887_04830 [Candidatus Kaiserbacteria bacterium]|nr:hypothetical protein [Candidatus Kaiserbacteria bacterium]
MKPDYIHEELAFSIASATRDEIEESQAFVKAITEFKMLLEVDDKYGARSVGRMALKLCENDYADATQLINLLAYVLKQGADRGFDLWLLMDYYFEKHDKRVSDTTRLKVLNKYW